MNNSVVLLSVFVGLYVEVYCKSKIRKFPQDFLFGASTSAYQIEGGWHEEGKGLSIWDVGCHTEPSPIKDESTGDEAADSYHKYQRDVEIAQELGLEFYRFSISWPRILPNGFTDRINSFGVNHYHDLIDELISKNITPVVTMYHWDLPNNLQKLGGWANPSIIGWYTNYAKILFEKFGEKVKHWITINEPKEICFKGYGSDTMAPFLNITGIAEYLCAKNVLLAHAKTYHMYDELFRKLQNGTIGISLSFVWYEAASDAMDDYQAALDARQFEWGQYAHPIFSKAGDFPVEVKKNVAFKSAEQGFANSRLPELSAKEVALIRGSADFLGVNAYTTKLAYRDASLEGMYGTPSYMDDMGAVLVKDPSWTQSQSSWLQDVPWGFFKLLMEIRKLYDNPPVYITENGWSTEGGLLDEGRIQYLRTYLNALLDALDEGCDVRGYSVWSLIDTFEWQQGYLLGKRVFDLPDDWRSLTHMNIRNIRAFFRLHWRLPTKSYSRTGIELPREKFGLYEVDFSSPDKTRTPRKSSFIYKEIIKSKKLDPDFEPERFIIEVSKETTEKGRGDNDVM